MHDRSIKTKMPTKKKYIERVGYIFLNGLFKNRVDHLLASSI